MKMIRSIFCHFVLVWLIIWYGSYSDPDEVSFMFQDGFGMFLFRFGILWGIATLFTIAFSPCESVIEIIFCLGLIIFGYCLSELGWHVALKCGGVYLIYAALFSIPFSKKFAYWLGFFGVYIFLIGLVMYH